MKWSGNAVFNPSHDGAWAAGTVIHAGDHEEPIKIAISLEHAMVHSWSLFGAGISPGNEPVTNKGGLCFGLLHFREALSKPMDDFSLAVANEQESDRDS